MKDRPLAALWLAAMTVSGTAVAHHSAIAFEKDKTMALDGTVTEWFWANPHCLLKFDVATADGSVVHWVAETQAPANMIEAGWRKNDMKPGESVMVTLLPARNGNPVGRILKIDLADGRTLAIDEDKEVGRDYHLSGAPTP